MIESLLLRHTNFLSQLAGVALSFQGRISYAMQPSQVYQIKCFQHNQENKLHYVAGLIAATYLPATVNLNYEHIRLSSNTKNQKQYCNIISLMMCIYVLN